MAETSEGILNKEAGRAFRLCGVIDGAQSLMNRNENKSLTFNSPPLIPIQCNTLRRQPSTLLCRVRTGA